MRSNENIMDGISSDELIGPWFSYLHTTCLFALVSCVFGIAHCFRHIEEFEWYKGNIKQRILRILVAWLTMIPSWILVFY